MWDEIAAIREFHEWVVRTDDPTEEDLARMATWATEIAVVNETRIAVIVAELRAVATAFDERRSGDDLATALRIKATILETLAEWARLLADAEDAVTLVSHTAAHTHTR